MMLSSSILNKNSEPGPVNAVPEMVGPNKGCLQVMHPGQLVWWLFTAGCRKEFFSRKEKTGSMKWLQQRNQAAKYTIILNAKLFSHGTLKASWPEQVYLLLTAFLFFPYETRLASMR
jgi:hypothetical protein